MSAAREEVLRRVRAALSDVPSGEASGDVEVERSYRRAVEPPEGRLELLAERLADYRATVRRPSRDSLAGELADACAERGARRLLVPSDLPDEWRPEGVELVPDERLSPEEIEEADGVLTGCALAIAETGTFVLDGGARQGRRAISLLPDLHLCVVEAEQVVGGVPEALARLEPAAREGRPITFVSGPSATSDIELDRVEGVHGPRDLVVLVVGP